MATSYILLGLVHSSLGPSVSWANFLFPSYFRSQENSFIFSIGLIVCFIESLELCYNCTKNQLQFLHTFIFLENSGLLVGLQKCWQWAEA